MKIVLADDHKIVRDGLRAILEKHPGMEVVGEAENGHEAIAVAQRTAPDVVVMDISMPGLNGVDSAKRIAHELPRTRVIALSMCADRRYVLAMLSAGAAGYLLKNAAAGELIRAIETTATGRTYLSPEIAGVVVETLRERSAPEEPTSAGVLSAREREVLQLLAEGRTSKEIAAQLHVAVTTVETHRRQIMAKLGLHSIAELTKYAIREGLTSLDR
jgi:two-component system, NarL family, response regulator NreC